MSATSRMDGYVRVSRRMGREGDSYISPKVQRDAIERWAEYKGVEIAEMHFDEDHSGGMHRRPGLERAIERAVRGETDGIVAWKIDRFSRRTSLALRDLERLEEAGARLAFVVEDIDTGTPHGKMIYTILLAVSSAFLDNIKASWIETKRRAVERGAYISRTPFGYARQSDGTLSPHPTEAPIVREAFRLAASAGIGDALSYLESAAPERKWTTPKVRRLLSGQSYLGKTVSGDMERADTHEALVSRATREAAQTAPAARKGRSEYPLSGLVRCSSCGAPMIGSRGGKGQRVYRCANTRSAGVRSEPKCEQGSVITAERVETFVVERARDLFAGLRATVGAANDVEALERALADAEAELDAFAADLTLRRALGERYETHLNARVEAVEAAKTAYREKARVARANLTLRASDILTSRDPELLRLLLGSVFEAIDVSPGRGLSVERRVAFVPLDDDSAARVTAPQSA